MIDFDVLGELVLVKGEVFFAEFEEFLADLLEVGAKTDDFLKTSQGWDVEEVGLVVDEEVAELVGFFGEVLSE